MQLLKKLFYVILIAVVALFAMTFMMQNQQLVSVSYAFPKLFSLQWEQRLSVVLVAAFCSGAVFTILFGLLSSLRLRGRLFSTKRKLKRVEKDVETNAQNSQALQNV